MMGSCVPWAVSPPQRMNPTYRGFVIILCTLPPFQRSALRGLDPDPVELSGDANDAHVLSQVPVEDPSYVTGLGGLNDEFSVHDSVAARWDAVPAPVSVA